MDKLREYAKLVVTVGLNVLEGENLFINAEVETKDFVQLIVEEAYNVKAREVYVNWNCTTIDRLRLLHNDDQVYESFPEYTKVLYEHFDTMNTNYLAITSASPEALKGVDANRMSKAVVNAQTALKAHSQKVMANEYSWCVIGYPSLAWAKIVFPELEPTKAYDRLLTEILNVVRVGEGRAVNLWQEHLLNLKKRADFLTKQQFIKLIYSSSNGTKLEVGLVKNHLWAGGGEDNVVTKKYFVANMPTEECFTMPDCNNVNGIVYNTKPLSYNGNIIDEFWLKFLDGRVEEFDAKVGKEFLTELLNTDDGARRIGEVALVPFDSPISNTNILFYNTLFDENASCHLALGKAYSINLQDYNKYTKDELAQIGVNDSLIHVDFMIGANDTNIVGVKADETTIEVFKDGNFVI